MKYEQVCQTLKTSFRDILEQNKLLEDQVQIRSVSLSPEEAIGITERKDFPILTGKEIMLQTSYLGSSGQAFTDAPAVFNGSLNEIMNMDIIGDAHARGLFIATMNAVMRHLGLIENTIHCKGREPEECAQKFVQYIKDNYSSPKIALIGYQPAILENLSREFDLRVLDLNPENIGKTRYNTLVENGLDDYDEVVLNWADLVLCTGSTICNGSIVNFMDIGKEVLFFGTTLAGAAKILELNRVCFCSA